MLLTLLIALILKNKLKQLILFIHTYVYGLSSLAKELPAAASVMQSSSKESSTLVADRA